MDTTSSPVDAQQLPWASTPTIDDIAPFSEEDAACFREVRNVLFKHGALDRFGLSLIHKHFDISDDEVLVEYTDGDSRELVTKPVKKDEARRQDLVVTQWKLTEGEVVAQVGCSFGRTHRAGKGINASG